MTPLSTSEYGAAFAPARGGGLVAAVQPNSAAIAAGIAPGDLIVAVAGRPVRDVLDWWWMTSSGGTTVTVQTAAGEARTEALDVANGEDPGVIFADVLFDGVRTCANACLFCFVGQLPDGLRRSLYVRDDDFRLSFLFGNFVTLTNLSDTDVARIGDQHLSPLYVSLHAVDPEVRAKLVCAVGEDRGLSRFDEMLAAGILLHVQIVLVPEVNDGVALQHTIEWLAERPGVASVGVVPLGYTEHVARFSRSFDDRVSAGEVLDALDSRRRWMMRERGEHWVYASDELYLVARRPLPPYAEYDGFPQFENGIGLTRAFTDEFSSALNHAARRAHRDRLPESRVTLVTGTLFAPILADMAPRLHALGVGARVLPVENRFLGGNISVAGLLTGADVVAAIAADEGPGPYLVPDVVANADGLMLDDVLAADLGSLTGADVALVASHGQGLVTALTQGVT